MFTTAAILMLLSILSGKASWARRPSRLSRVLGAMSALLLAASLGLIAMTLRTDGLGTTRSIDQVPATVSPEANLEAVPEPDGK